MRNKLYSRRLSLYHSLTIIITIYDIINWFCSPQRYNYTRIHAYIPAHTVCNLHMSRRIRLWSFDIISEMLIKPTLAEFELSSIRGTKSFPRLNSVLSCAWDEALLTSVFKCFECLGLLLNKLILTVRYIIVSDKLYFTSSSVIGEMPFYNYQNIRSMSQYMPPFN